MASPNGANKKRHASWDTEATEGTSTDYKRICMESSRSPMGLDPPLNSYNIWEVGPSNVFPNGQFFGTTSEPFNNLIALPSTQVTAEQYIYDTFSSIPKYEQIPGADYSAAAGCAPPFHACSSYFQDAYDRSYSSLNYCIDISIPRSKPRLQPLNPILLQLQT